MALRNPQNEKRALDAIRGHPWWHFLIDGCFLSNQPEHAFVSFPVHVVGALLPTDGIVDRKNEEKADFAILGPLQKSGGLDAVGHAQGTDGVGEGRPGSSGGTLGPGLVIRRWQVALGGQLAVPSPVGAIADHDNQSLFGGLELGEGGTAQQGKKADEQGVFHG